MKKIISLAAVVMLSLTTHAQTNTTPVPTSPQTFFQSAETYFTTIDYSNKSFETNSLSLSAGTDFLPQGVTTASLNLSVRVYHGSSIDLAAIDTVRNAGIGGIIASEQGGIAARKLIGNLRASLELSGGYSWVNRAPYLEGGLWFEKMATDTTFAGVGIMKDIGRRAGLAPLFGIRGGFNF